MTCGIILSGGLSRRFQKPDSPWIDKALYPINGKPMIMHIIDKAKEILNELIIAVNNEDRANRYREIIPNVKYVTDHKALTGPLAGIYSGLKACNEDHAVILPNDTPYITPNNIELLIKYVQHFDTATYILPNGHIVNALIALRKDIALEILNELSHMGRSKIFDIVRGSPKAIFLNPQTHGLDPKTLTNINTRKDLETKNTKSKTIIKNDISIIRNFTIEDVHTRNTTKLIGSLWYTIITKDYIPEFKLYTEAGLHDLSAHVLLDSNNENTKTLGRLILKALGVEKA
nr:MAG: molybdenum cofactor guanylyltransferase [Vulcanisaeta sp. AZ3]